MSDPGSEYAGLSWQQIQEDILSGNPGSLSAAAVVFSSVQQGLSAVLQTVNAALGTLTGGADGSSGWQGPAAQAFATATGALVSGIQSLSDVLQSSGGGSVSDLLNENSSKLSWAQNQIQSIGGEFAVAAAQAGAPVSQSGLVSPPTSMSEKITSEMLAVLTQLAQDYDQTITALQSQIPTSSAFGSGTNSDDSSSSGNSSGSNDSGGASPSAASGTPPGQAAFAISGTGSNTGANDADTSGDSAPSPDDSDTSGNSNADSGDSDTSAGSNPPTVSSEVSGAVSTPPATSATPASSSSSSGSADSSGSGTGVDGWINSAFSVLEANGVSASQLSSSDVNLIIQHESGGNPSAVNNWDSNAAAGDPSQGLMQTTGQTFNAYALPGYNSNILDPVSNIIAGVRYALATYGSLNNVPGVVAVDSGGSYVGY